MTAGGTAEPLWDEAGRLELPPLEEDAVADVAVVGLGGSGLAAVLEAVRAGASVVGLDAGPVAAGAAGRNAGFLLAGAAPFHHDLRTRIGRARAAAIYEATLDELDHIEATAPDQVSRKGSLRIALDDLEVRDIEAHLRALHEDGFAGEPYEGAEGVGLLVPGDGVTQPVARCHHLALVALTAGARLHERSAAVDVGDGIVRTESGTVRARAVVVAVDGGLERLVPALAPRVRTARLQVLATAPAADVSLPRPVYARYGYDYWRQLRDGRIVLGGLRDRFEAAEWAREATPTEPVQRALEVLLRERLGTDAAVTHRWAGCVGYTPDGLPVVHRLSLTTVVVGAYSGTGNVIGSRLGRAAVRMALHGDTSLAQPFLDAADAGG